MNLDPPTWPDGRRFAFTIFDDPDGQSYQTTRLVYAFLADLGFRTTIGVWPLDIRRVTNSGGETCANPEYRAYLQELQNKGFEIGFHLAAPYNATRAETIEALDLFQTYFGHDPVVMANHYNEDAIYWGPARLVAGGESSITSLPSIAPATAILARLRDIPSFWGDVCCERIRYCRNFVYADINTLRMNPWMPYYDAERPYVRRWYSSSEGHDAAAFLKTLQDVNQDPS